MSHLSMESLVSLREPGIEPGQAAAREHLAQCPECQSELERLHQRVARLKSLPNLRPARDRWPETLARFRSQRRRQRVRVAGLTGLAAAAGLAIVLGIGDLARSPSAVEPSLDQLSQVMQTSQVLETALNDFNPEGRVLDGRTARIAQELEERIARVDRELEATELLRQQAQNQDLLRLWRERVGLLDALVDVHMTRASNAGL
jgi:hypothetical protein